MLATSASVNCGEEESGVNSIVSRPETSKPGSAEPIARFKDRQKLILGICNGFQILIKSGILLPDDASGVAPATLTWNDTRKYEDRWVHLAVVSERCVFLRGIRGMYLPVAHGEGKFIARDEATLDRLEAAGQLPLRYAAPSGAASGRCIGTLLSISQSAAISSDTSGKHAPATMCWTAASAGST